MLNMTKFAASTMLLIDFWPIDSRFFRNQSGDAPTLTPLIYPAIYRAHKGVSIETSPCRDFVNPDMGSRSGSPFIGIFKIAESPFAIPRCGRQSCPRFGVTL